MRLPPSSRLLFALALVLAVPLARRAQAIEYKVEIMAEMPPADAFSPAIVAQLQPAGFKVVSSSGRTLCDVWLCKQWPVTAGFSATPSVLYPFEMGQLLGAVRYQRKGADFRGQEIVAGAYTLRYSLQPEDGNHVGTSDTRDFGVLLPASEDKQSGPVPKESLFKLSTKASGTSHPCILSLMAAGNVMGTLPAIAHQEERDLWIVGFDNKTLAGGKAGQLRVELVVVGKAAE